MIYVESDFYSNFNAITTSNDEVAFRSLLIDQLSNLIAYNREELLDLFQKANIKVSKKPKNNEIVRAITKNIKTNKKLVIGLSYLIAKENELLQEQLKNKREEDISEFSDDKRQNKPVDWDKTFDAVNAIGGSISVWADTLTGVKTGNFESALNSATNGKSPEEIEREKKQKEEEEKKRLEEEKKRQRNIKIAVVSLTVIGVAIGGYFAWKKGWFSKTTN